MNAFAMGLEDEYLVRKLHTAFIGELHVRKEDIANVRRLVRANIHDELPAEMVAALKVTIKSLPHVWASFTLFGEDFAIVWHDWQERWEIKHPMYSSVQCCRGELERICMTYGWRVAIQNQTMRMVEEANIDPNGYAVSGGSEPLTCHDCAYHNPDDRFHGYCDKHSDVLVENFWIHQVDQEGTDARECPGFEADPD